MSSAISRPRALGRQDSRNPRQIWFYRKALPILEQLTEVRLAAEAEFHDQPASGTQDSRRIGGDPIVDFKAGSAAEQRQFGLPVANLALQSVALGERHVRWVADDQVETALTERVHEIAHDKAHRRAEQPGVLV